MSPRVQFTTLEDDYLEGPVQAFNYIEYLIALAILHQANHRGWRDDDREGGFGYYTNHPLTLNAN